MHRLSESTPETDVFEALLERRSANSEPWGLEFGPGENPGKPVTIASIRAGSPADRIGLKQGDEVTEIGDARTSAMTHDKANQLIKQYGLSLILTIERRARGAAGHAPKVIRSTGPPTPASYQTYDMTGKPNTAHYPQNRPAPRPQPRTDPNMEYYTASARVYDPPPTTGPRYQPPPPPQPQPQPQTYTSPAAVSAVDGHERYIPEEDKIDGPVQSRTFKILQSLMQNEDYRKASGPVRMPSQRTLQDFLYDEPTYNGFPVQSRSFQALSFNVLPEEEPYAGSSGLPPPRSASMEEWKRQEQAKRESPRVKVFMPQAYNTPLGLYTTENIMDSFQSQAGAHMDQMDQYQQDPVSGAQRAVMESEFIPPGASDL